MRNSALAMMRPVKEDAHSSSARDLSTLSVCAWLNWNLSVMWILWATMMSFSGTCGKEEK